MTTGFSTGVANPNEYLVGRGVVYFASLSANGFPKEFRDLGNCTTFTGSMAVEEIIHQSSRAGLKVTDKKVVVSQEQSLAFTLDECNLDNIALFMAGDTATRTQTAGAVIGNQNVWMSGYGRWYDLYETADLSAAYPPTVYTNRVYDITTVSIIIDPAGATLVLGTDYEVDLDMGRIFIKPAPTAAGITTASKLDVTFTKTSRTIEEVRGLKVSSIAGALKFISENPANNSLKRQFQWHKVTLSGSGDFGLISDEFATMSFTAKAEAAEAVDPLSPTVRLTHVTA